MHGLFLPRLGPLSSYLVPKRQMRKKKDGYSAIPSQISGTTNQPMIIFLALSVIKRLKGLSFLQLNRNFMCTMDRR